MFFLKNNKKRRFLQLSVLLIFAKQQLLQSSDNADTEKIPSSQLFGVSTVTVPCRERNSALT